MAAAKSRRKQEALRGKELKALFEEIDRRYREKCRPTEKDILAEIQAYRKEKSAPGE